MRESIRKNRAHGERDRDMGHRSEKPGRGAAQGGRFGDASRKAWMRHPRDIEDLLDADETGRSHARVASGGGRW